MRTRERIADAEGRAAQHRQAQTDRIAESRRRVADSERARHAARGEDVHTAQAAHDHAVAEHMKTVDDALNKLVAASRSAGAERWEAFRAGMLDRRETFAAVAQERVRAARAAADARQEYYDLQTGSGKPSDRSGPLTELTDAELEHRITHGTDNEKDAALNELNRRVTGKVKRFTQDMADLLMEHAPVEVDTGEGKEMLVVLRSVRIALDDGLAHVMTSSDPLVDHMQHEFLKLVGERSLNLNIYHLDSDQPFPQRTDGDKLIVVGTAQDYGFRAVKEAQAMIDELKETGLAGDELKALQRGLGDAPTFQEYKQLLDSAAEARGLDTRFEPFPGGKLTVDEIDAQLIDEQTHYVISPGKGEQASPEFVAKTKDIWNSFQRAKDESVLGAADFGKNPDIPGMFDSRLTDAGRDKLETMLGKKLTDTEAEEYAHAAQAEWGPQHNTDYHVSDDNKIKIISSATNDQLMDDPEKQSSSRWNGFAKYLEVKHGTGDDSNITADPEYSISITGKQLFTGGHFDIRGTSGTLLTSTAETPRGVEDIMHDEYGTGPIARVERFFTSHLNLRPDQHFANRNDKFTQMAKDILDTAFVPNPDTGKLEQRGFPQLGVAMDNADVARLASAVRQEAAARDLHVELEAIDAAWMDSFGSKRAAYDRLQEIIAEGGRMGKITLGNKVMSRGVDITPDQEAIEKGGGLKVKISGGPAYSARVNHQVETRASRSGDLARGGRDEGGTPGEAVHYISPEDYLSSAPNPRVKTLVVRYQNAAKSHTEAAETHAAEPPSHNEAHLERTADDLARATSDLREIATPAQKAAVEQRLIDSRRVRTYAAHAPPVLDSTAHQPTTPPPRTDGSLASEAAARIGAARIGSTPTTTPELDIPTFVITDPSGTPQAHDAGEHHREQSTGEHPASTQTYPTASHEPPEEYDHAVFAPARPPVSPATDRTDSVVARAAEEFENIFDQPLGLEQLYHALRPEWPDLSFDDLQTLRTHSYRENGISPPPVARENMDAFVHGIWNRRESFPNWNSIYNAYLDRGAGEPPDARTFKDEVVQILAHRAGPAQQADMEEVGVLTPGNAGNWAPQDIPVVHFTRENARPQDCKFKIYINAAGNARSRVLAHLVREVLDDPVRFPGVGEVKAFGPGEQRVDNVVTYASDLDAVYRVLAWLREFQAGHLDMFLWDAPTGSEQELAGVGFAAEARQGSFGSSRATAIANALNMHRHGTFDDFYNEVQNQFIDKDIDPDEIHLNLPLEHDTIPESAEESSSPTPASEPTDHDTHFVRMSGPGTHGRYGTDHPATTRSAPHDADGSSSQPTSAVGHPGPRAGERLGVSIR